MPDNPRSQSPYDIISSNAGRLIEATHASSGARSRFQAVSHFDIGRGWNLIDIDGKVAGLVADRDLQMVVALDITRSEAVAQNRWKKVALSAGGPETVERP